jgi:hypothetical protein
MNNTNRSRRDSSAKHRVPARPPHSQKELETTDTDESAARLFAFTIDARTGQIVKFESLDARGARHELSDEEKTTIVSDSIEGGLEDLVEQAFEAGIACVLGDANGELAQDSREDAEIRRLLLRPLIERSAAKRFLQREVLSRVILGALVRQSITSGPAPPEGEPAAGLQ